MDRWDKYAQGLNPLFLPRYHMLRNRLPENWGPYQGLRTFDQQDVLYSRGRTAMGPKVTNAKGGESPHCYGCAVDLTVWDANGKPLWYPRNHATWIVLVDAVSSIKGLRSGVSFGDIDHVELKIATNWIHIHECFLEGDMEAANEEIRHQMID